MSMPDPENTRIDHPIEDSGIHIRDTEHAPVTLWQMLITGLLVVAILTIFFYGLTEQREEVTGPPQQQAATNVPPAQEQPNVRPLSNQGGKPATTGQSTK
jgi:hypothetical protein